MKKYVLLLIVAFFSVSIASGQSRALKKAQKKEYKTKMKRYEKEGWTLFASSRTLEVALLKHYEKLDAENAKEESGTASRFKSKNVGLQMAINNACIKYAQSAGSYVKGRNISEAYGNAVDASGEFDRFYAAYERLVEKEIRGEMELSYAVIKSNGDGTYEAEVFFIVDEVAASKARMRALENAAKESEAARKWARGVSKFVQERFNNQ